MSFEVINIGIFPSEAENAFELARSLKYTPRFNVIGLANAACQSYFEFENIRNNLPYIHEENFLEEFARILQEENISYVFPTHDSVALFLKEKEHLLPAKVLCSGLEVTRLCRDKALLYDFLKEEDFCPRVFSSIKEINNFPVFIKPRDGQGGQDCLKINSQEDFQKIVLKASKNSLQKVSKTLLNTQNILICEYLSGEEFTLDCFTNTHGELLFCGPRSRDVVKLGMSFVCPTVALTEKMSFIAKRLNTLLVPKGLCGLWFFQLKKDKNGKLKILEVATRVAGTMALYRQRGINFAQLSLYNALGFDVSILDNQTSLRLTRSIHACYENPIEYDIVFMDLDDTLIVRNKVNLLALCLLYQCANEKKKIILLTRHEGEVLPYLQKFCIAENLFDDIITLYKDEKKSDSIQKISKKYNLLKKAIFIDNLFIERQEVQKKLGIPVFDVDAMESLLKQHI